MGYAIDQHVQRAVDRLKLGKRQAGDIATAQIGRHGGRVVLRHQKRGRRDRGAFEAGEINAGIGGDCAWSKIAGNRRLVGEALDGADRHPRVLRQEEAGAVQPGAAGRENARRDLD